MHRILVVDDERLVADTIGLIFRKHGFETKVTYDAHEAVACARKFRPNLLLCDISMPKRSGLELMADFTVEFPECRILVLTGYYTNLIRVRDRAHTMARPTRVLTKPCNPDELLREAGKILLSA